MLIIGSILLHAVKGTSRELLIEVVRDPASGSSRQILTKQSSAGSFSQPNVSGAAKWKVVNPDGHPNSPAYGHLKLPHLN